MSTGKIKSKIRLQDWKSNPGLQLPGDNSFIEYGQHRLKMLFTLVNRYLQLDTKFSMF